MNGTDEVLFEGELEGVMKGLRKKRTNRILHWTTELGILMFLLTILTLISCSSKKETAVSASLLEPVKTCEVLSVAEVEDLIGGSVDAPRKTFKEQGSPKLWMSMCNYDSQERQISMGITVKPHGKKENGKQAFADYEAELVSALGPDYKLEDVSSIGDAAGWDPSSKQLTVFKGPYLVIVGVVGPNLEAQDALSLCKKVCDKFLVKLSSK